jgi:hypothetical protein
MKSKLLTSATMPAMFDGLHVSGVWIDEADTLESWPGFPIHAGEIVDEDTVRETLASEATRSDP